MNGSSSKTAVPPRRAPRRPPDARPAATADPTGYPQLVAERAGAEATAGHSLGSYVEAFGPGPAWSEWCAWPPDVFALTNLILDHTEAYRLAVAPPAGRRWPPLPAWNREVTAAAHSWRAAADQPGGATPRFIQQHWQAVTACRDVRLSALHHADRWELWEALLTLHATADEACAGLATASSASGQSFEQQAWRLLAAHGSLSRLLPARVRVTPKIQLASRGITIRSLSRYLALSYEAVDLRWRRIASEIVRPVQGASGQREYNIVLLPWPLHVEAADFRPVSGPLENMDRDTFGFFAFSPRLPLDLTLVQATLSAAKQITPTVHAVILPESAVDVSELPMLEATVEPHEVTFLVAGMRERARHGGLGRNYLHLGVRTAEGWQRYQQAKHHRWCLDEAQIHQYHLCHQLDPRKQWWEAIQLPPRTLEVIDVGDGATTVPLICEDLARMDEVTDLVRRIGPGLVVAVLLDGPQLATRWPCRYATVLADEPGSAVLTLTSLGMAARSTPSGMKRSRVVGLWNDPHSNLREFELARGASGILITASVGTRRAWTADGRRHDGTPHVTLSAVHQLRAHTRQPQDDHAHRSAAAGRHAADPYPSARPMDPVVGGRST
jgi:hypothetical protein